MHRLRSLRFHCIVVVLLVVATFSRPEGQLASTSRAQDSVELTFLYALPEPDNSVMRESVLPAWQERYPDVTIEPVPVPLDSLKSRISTEAESGNQFDLLLAPAYWRDEIGFWFGPLPCCIREPLPPGYFDLSLDAMTVDDTLLGRPMDFSTVALVYNTSLIATPPETTDELREEASSLALGDLKGFGLTPSFYLNAGFFSGFGGQVFTDEGEAELDSPEVVEFLEFLQRLGAEPGVVYGSTDEIQAGFLDGEIAMTIGGPELVQAARDALGSENVGVTILPSISERDGAAALPFLDVTGVFVTSDDEAYAEEAFVFAEWMATDGAQILIDGGAGLLPVNSEVRPPDDPAVSAFLEQAEMATLIPSDPGMDEVWEPATEMIASVLEGQASPEEAAAAANEQVDRR